jgi:hypothetical protein
MRVTELVRHVVKTELEKHQEIDNSTVVRSLSTKFADPRLSQTDFSPNPVRTLSEIVAESMYRVDWETTPVSNPDELRESLLESVLIAYKQDRNIDHVSTPETGQDSEDRPNNRAQEEIIEADPDDIDSLETAFDHPPKRESSENEPKGDVKMYDEG